MSTLSDENGNYFNYSASIITSRFSLVAGVAVFIKELEFSTLNSDIALF
jgi:hypothetical protein